jgi:hypothetical protein
MREVMKKLGLELDETVDTLGVNHRLATRARKRFKKARVVLKLEREARNPYNDCKEYAV